MSDSKEVIIQPTPEHSLPVINEVAISQPDLTIKEAPVVMCGVEAAAALHAVEYRAETQRASLLSFCQSTGHSSYGPMDLMIKSLRMYGYTIKGMR